MNLEEQLRAALQRKEPPAGFRDRVVRAARERSPWRRVAAAAVLMAVLGGTTVRYVEQRREGERAKEQVLQALRITSHQLRDTREQIHDVSNH